jgi:hypothetical protein
MPEAVIDLHYTLKLKRELDEAELQSLTDAVAVALAKKVVKYVTEIEASASYTVDGVPVMAMVPNPRRAA